MYRDRDKQREAWRRYYWKNRDQKLKEKKEKRRELRKKLHEYKETLKCARCSEDNVVCLEFHHNNGHKDFSISNFMNVTLDWIRVKAEIDKCEVLCANCHRKEHASNDKR